jgi:hypothetical protein
MGWEIKKVKNSEKNSECFYSGVILAMKGVSLASQ